MDKPNILLITSDQQHYMTMGINNKQIKTPNLDRLAKMGMSMDRTYCPNPTCTPTRASIITGQYPSTHGAWTLGTKLPEDKLTIGDILLDEGYETTLIGKAHFQPTKKTDDYDSLESLPLLHDLEYWREFNEVFYGFKNIELLRNHTNEWLVGQHYVLWLQENGFDNWKKYFLEPVGTMKHAHYVNPLKLLHDNHGDISNCDVPWGVWDIPLEAHYNTFISSRTNAYLEKAVNDNKPFMIWASFPDPHPDYFVPKPYASMYDPEQLDITLADEDEFKYANELVLETQKLNPNFDKYQESGFYTHGLHSHIQDEKSLRQDIAWYYGMVTFMDEHIGKILDKLEALDLIDNTIIIYTSDHGHYFGQHGLIRKGPFHYEDGIKVPFLISYPKMIRQGVRSNGLHSLVDIMPTLLDLVNIDCPINISGVSQKDVLCDRRESVRSEIICENRHERNNLNVRTYVDERYKITVYQDRSFGDMFDLQNDPCELHNLWDEKDYSELKNELLQKFISAELRKEIMMMPRIAHA